MNKKDSALKWGEDFLLANSYAIDKIEIILETPWSSVARFTCKTGNIYLKQTPAAIHLSIEPEVIKFLSEKSGAHIPQIIAGNDQLHCFLMKYAGNSLRDILKCNFQAKLLCQAIMEYAQLQRSTENYINELFKMGIPDWRVDKLPGLYNQLLEKSDFLKAEGLTEQELQTLRDLNTKVLEQCSTLASYEIPAVLGQHDFHDKNTLIDSVTGYMTFIDLGEVAIVHPFFSLNTCLQQAITHHAVKEFDDIYTDLQKACFENWRDLYTNQQLLNAFVRAKQLWPIYSALSCYELMINVNLQAYKSFYPTTPSKLASYLRQYTAQI